MDYRKGLELFILKDKSNNAFLISFIASGLIASKAQKHAELYPIDMPQRFHQGAIPRLGGIALALGIVGGSSIAYISNLCGWILINLKPIY